MLNSLASILQGGAGGGAATAYESIATVTVGSGGSSSISFSSIPSTYTHLQLRCILRGDRTATGDDVKINFNSDTGANYSAHFLYAEPPDAPASDSAINQSFISFRDGIPAASSASGIFGATIIDILDYANTNKYKTTRMLNGTSQNSAGSYTDWIELASGSWRSTSAINNITFTPRYGTNFSQYSQIALYGIKGS